MGAHFKPSKKLTVANVEEKIMAIRYKKAYDKLWPALHKREQDAVKYDEANPNGRMGYSTQMFVRAVITLAESEERL